MASQTHVLILIDTNRIFDEFIDKIICKLTKEGYVQHHVFKQDKTGAEAWVKSLNQMKKRVPGKDSKTEHSDAGTRGATTRGVRFCPPFTTGHPKRFHLPTSQKKKAKYLLVDWFSAAGYEAPAVIFVTDDLNRLKNATYCQRAKAKLTIYIAKDPRRRYKHLSRGQYLQFLFFKRIFLPLAVVALLAVIPGIYGLYYGGRQCQYGDYNACVVFASSLFCIAILFLFCLFRLLCFSMNMPSF